MKISFELPRKIMNYLAHFYLSDQTPEGFLGGILGDFVRGKVQGKFTPTIEREIEIHRRIDFFTDTNEIVRKSKKRVAANRSKYAGVLVDVFYDHYLALNFENYSNISLKDFSTDVYQSLKTRNNSLDESLQTRLMGIAHYDLLSSYVTLEGIGLALYRISKRLKRENNLAEGIFDIKNNYAEMQKDFEEFFPQLIEFVNIERKKMLDSE